jgi:hypothetical protein
MRRQHVASSAISSVGYDERSSVLEVEFESGAVYDYFNVPPRVHQDLLKAPARDERRDAGYLWCRTARAAHDAPAVRCAGFIEAVEGLAAKLAVHLRSGLRGHGDVDSFRELPAEP